MKLRKKKALLITAIASFILAVGLVVTSNLGYKLSNIVYGSFEHDANCYWNHYAYKAPTETEPGCKEYWICCEHHTPEFSKPTIGKNIDAEAVEVSSEVISYLKNNKDDPRYIAPSFNLKTAVFADVQLCHDKTTAGTRENLGTTANATLALKSHLAWCKENNVDVLFMNGDICNNAISDYYVYYQSIFEGVYGKDKSTYPEIIWNMGNHEWWDNDEHDTSIAVSLFNQYANIDSKYLVKKSAVKYYLDSNVTLPSYYKVVKGIPFLVISGENSSGKIGTTLKNEIASWLSEIKQLDSVKAGGPIYVAYHYPISTTLTHGSGANLTNSTIVENLLKDYPTAILFTGDTHYSGINERAINQVDFTSINIGSSSYSRMDTKSATMKNDEHFYNMLTSGSKIKDTMVGNANYLCEYTPTIHVMDTLGDYSTKINRYFSNEVLANVIQVGKTWLIPSNVSKSTFAYTNARFQNVASAQSLYGKNGLNWHNDAKVKYNVIDGNMTVEFPDVIDYHFCEHFKITVTANTGNSKVYDVVSNYYKYSLTPENLYFVLKDLPNGTSYSLSVRAYDYFDNPSINTLSSSTPTAQFGIDALDDALDQTYCDISHRVNIDEVTQNSGSSLEYYYKGIHAYNAGAILNRPYYAEGVGAQDYLSIGYGEDLKVVLTMKVKNLKSDPIKVGMTVVDGKGQWKTDFGVEYQVEISGNSDWTLVEWDLSELFGIHSRNEMSHIGIKAKSVNMPTSGYEMHFLIDELDIKGEGSAPRGEAFTGGSNKDIIIPSTSTSSGSITIDVKFTSDANSCIAFSLLNTSNWNNYIGYLQICGDGSKKWGGNYQGVSVTLLSDGYYRIVIDFVNVTEISGSKPATINEVFVRGNWTDASGYIEVNPSSSPEPVVIRGSAFRGATDFTKDLKGSEVQTIATDTFIVDIKFTSSSDTFINLMLGEGWSKYFGYYQINADGTLNGNYSGVSIAKLSDGYYRVTFVLKDLVIITGSSPETNINLVYIRGSWTTASGYIDFPSI